MNSICSSRPVLRQRTPQRAMRWAMLTTLRDLRRSVANNRPMSLPNFLRLYQRRLGISGQEGDQNLLCLQRLYRQHQPFAGGPQVLCRRRLAS